MKKQSQLGLVVEGKSASSAVLRLPTVASDLGPIKSASLRVARRLSNMLHAGYAVSDYEELQAARTILLRIPDASLARIVDELCAAELVLRDLSFVLCESWLPIEVLEPLRARGAAVATFVDLPSPQHNWFIVEGHISAVRQVRRLLERSGMRGLEIRPGSKSLLFAAELLTTALPLPLFVAARQALRASGISGNHLAAAMDQMGQKMFKDFAKGARLVWGGPLTECSPETADRHFEKLRRDYPQIAEIVDEQLDRLRQRIAKHQGDAARVKRRVKNAAASTAG
ncbi:MAG: hypothetical protein JO091_05575 [Acidobacteriaceae bacterium]|nr:hypothetical protein [Acidobacteriaceae bacterium]